MSDTAIEWATKVWNPVVGCTHVSDGCDNCYAARLASGRLKHHPVYAGLAEDGRFNGAVRLLPERLEDPLHWRKPARVFVNSMSDLFHDDVSDEFIAQVWAVMALASEHTFQVLTKRPGRMASLVGRQTFVFRLNAALQRRGAGIEELFGRWPLPNVWLGVSVENQHWADVRIPKLLETPAAVRFVSCEPLLGPVDLAAFVGAGTGTATGGERGSATAAPTAPATGDGPQEQQSNGGRRAPSSPLAGGGNAVGPGSARAWPGPFIDWVIAGGESGPDARPMHPQWARSLRDQCVAAGVPYFFKQWGEWAPVPKLESGFGRMVRAGDVVVAEDGRTAAIQSGTLNCELEGESGAVPMRRVGKRAAGRELDGHTWDQYPGGEG